MSWGVSPWVYPVWYSLGFLDLGDYSNIWRMNNTLLNNQQITEEIKKEITMYIETNENETTTTQKQS